MLKKRIYTFMSATLAILIPTPGRLALGVTVIIELSLLLFFGMLFNNVLEKVDSKKMKNLFLLAFLIFFATLFHRFLFFTLPDVAIQLGYIIYIPPISSYLIGIVFNEDSDVEKAGIIIKSYFIFIGFSLAFFLFRDVVGFGTVTLIFPSGLVETVLFNFENASITNFFATIPGSIFCVSLFLPLYSKLLKKIYGGEMLKKLNGVEAENV